MVKISDKLKKKTVASAKKKKSSSEQVFGSKLKVAHVKPAAQVKKWKPRLEAMLSRCALRYALAIAAPFHPDAAGACVPSYPSPPSQKVTGFARFTVSIGASGYGFAVISPCMANDGNLIYHSTSTYASNSANPMSANNTLNPVGVSRGSMLNLPYTVSQLTSGANQNASVVAGRIVSIGARVTYVGTTLNESGVYTLLSTSAHENVLMLANSASTAGSFVDSEVCGITRDACEITAFPVSSPESQYSEAILASSVIPYIYPYSINSSALNNGYVDSVGGANVGAACMIMHFTGVAGSDFLVEIVQHVEYTGRLVASVATASEADQRGFEIVSAAAMRLPSLKNASKGASTLTLMKGALMDVFDVIKPIAIRSIYNMGAALFL